MQLQRRKIRIYILMPLSMLLNALSRSRLTMLATLRSEESRRRSKRAEGVRASEIGMRDVWAPGGDDYMSFLSLGVAVT
jgi:hypothetical protein